MKGVNKCFGGFGDCSIKTIIVKIINTNTKIGGVVVIY